MNRNLQNVYKYIKFNDKGYGEIYRYTSNYHITNKVIYLLPFLSCTNCYLYIKEK